MEGSKLELGMVAKQKWGQTLADGNSNGDKKSWPHANVPNAWRV